MSPSFVPNRPTVRVCGDQRRDALFSVCRSFNHGGNQDASAFCATGKLCRHLPDRATCIHEARSKCKLPHGNFALHLSPTVSGTVERSTPAPTLRSTSSKVSLSFLHSRRVHAKIVREQWDCDPNLLRSFIRRRLTNCCIPNRAQHLGRPTGKAD